MKTTNEHKKLHVDKSKNNFVKYFTQIQSQ
jgi:hypothetical protein